MSLEQVIIDNTNAIKLLIATLTKPDMGIPVSEQNQTVTTEHPQIKEPESPGTTCNVQTPPIEDVVKALLTLSKKDRDSAVALLTRFKAKHARAVPEEDRAAFLNVVKERLAKLQEA